MIAGLDKNNDVFVKTIVDSYTCFTFIWNVFVEINSKGNFSEIISFKRISSCLSVEIIVVLTIKFVMINSLASMTLKL